MPTAPVITEETALPPVPALPLNAILPGDARTVLAGLPDASVDLIVTSPPYADQRVDTYGGVKPDASATLFLPCSVMAQVPRLLPSMSPC